MLGLLGGTFTPALLVDDILELPYDLVTNGTVPESAQSFIQQTLGVPILVDTINDVPTMQAFLTKPVNGIITDRPDLLISLTSPVPETATLPLMLLGLVGLVAGLRRRQA